MKILYYLRCLKRSFNVIMITLCVLFALPKPALLQAAGYEIKSPKNEMDSVIAFYLDKVNADSIQSYMQALEDFGTRFALAENRKQVAEWIRDKYIAMGYPYSVLDSFQFNRWYGGTHYHTWQYNVVCTYPGYQNPDSVYILGAHYDAIVPSSSNPFVIAPGADDNASGVAATIEIARIMKQYNYAPAYTIRFIAFAAEEFGLHGAWDYATKALNSGMDIICMINNDMISYCTLPQEEWKVSIQKYANSAYFTSLANDIISNFTVLTAVESTEYINRSDSWPFYQRGFKAIFFIEHEFTPHYHTVNDLVSTTNKDYAAEMTKISLGMLIHQNGLGTTTTPAYAFWTGSNSNDWSDPENWSNGILPDGNTSVSIEAGMQAYPLIEDELTIKELIIQDGASFTLDAGARLTVTENLMNLAGESGLVLLAEAHERSGSIQTASLLHFNENVEATVQLLVSDIEGSYSMISSPVGSQDISNGFYDSGDALFLWYEPAQTWVSYNNSTIWPQWDFANEAGSDFTPAKAYLASYSNSPLREFSGELNQGEHTIAVYFEAHPDDDYQGFNLAGNPYPSFIDWKATEGWGRNQLEATGSPSGYSFWVWNPEHSQYGAYHSGMSSNFGTLGASRYIPPMQGFWVKADETGQFTVNDLARVHRQEAGLLNGIAPGFIHLGVEALGSHQRDEIIIEIGNNIKVAGTKKLRSYSENACELYVVSNGSEYSILLMPEDDGINSFQLGFRTGTSSAFAIEAKSAGGFGQLLLEDLTASIVHDLISNHSYYFHADASADEYSFVLHLGNTGYESLADQQIKPYYYNNHLYVFNAESDQLRIALHDLSGRKLAVLKTSDPGWQAFRLELMPGIYVISASGRHSIQTNKIVVAR